MTYSEQIEGMPHAGYINDGLVWRIEAAEIAAEADARIAELVEALKAMIDAPPDFASHVSAIEKARAALAKAGADE
jgi:hypothetical protein